MSCRHFGSRLCYLLFLLCRWGVVQSVIVRRIMAAGGVPATLRNVLPTNEILAGWSTLEDARKWVDMPADTHDAICEALGDRGLDNIMVFATIDPLAIRTVAETLDMGQGKLLSPIERTLLGIMYNAARQKVPAGTCGHHVCNGWCCATPGLCHCGAYGVWPGPAGDDQPLAEVQVVYCARSGQRRRD